jgi:hypothetical protein
MPKRKKSDYTEEVINTSESIVAFSTSSFSSAKEQIANTWPSCWTLARIHSVKISLDVYRKQKLVLVRTEKFELLGARQICI